MKALLKKWLVGTQEKPYRIKGGIAAGLYIKVDPADKTQRILGLDEREIQPAFKHYAEKAAAFIDVGASDGYYGLVFHKFSPQGFSLLVESNPAFVEEQKQNYALNQIPESQYTSTHAYITNEEDQRKKKLVSVLADLPEMGFPALVKIDVEGNELEVLKGMEEVLQQKQVALIIETHSAQLEQDCLAYLQQRGFATGIIPNARWRGLLPESRQKAHNRWLWADNWR